MREGSCRTAPSAVGGSHRQRKYDCLACPLRPPSWSRPNEPGRVQPAGLADLGSPSVTTGRRARAITFALALGGSAWSPPRRRRIGAAALEPSRPPPRVGRTARTGRRPAISLYLSVYEIRIWSETSEMPSSGRAAARHSGVSTMTEEHRAEDHPHCAVDTAPHRRPHWSACSVDTAMRQGERRESRRPQTSPAPRRSANRSG